MIIGIIREKAPENRVAFVPETIGRLAGSGSLVFAVESGAGHGAGFSDDAYRKAGAVVLNNKKEVFAKSHIVFSIQPFYDGSPLGDAKIIVSHLDPKNNFDHLLVYQNRPVTVYSLKLIPCSRNAQPMDILSPMASLAGYRAVIKAAYNAGFPLPMFTTAAATLEPAQVLVLGTGAGGLQAISTARKLGASVKAYDTVPAAREKVENIGAEFIGPGNAEKNTGPDALAFEQEKAFIKEQKALLHQHIIKSDIVIAASLLGKSIPLPIERSSVQQMRPGSVIVDLGSASGKNCELTQDENNTWHNGVEIIGESCLVREMAPAASRLLSAGHAAFLKHLVQKHKDEKDEILSSARIFTNGKITHRGLLQFMEV